MSGTRHRGPFGNPSTFLDPNFYTHPKSSRLFCLDPKVTENNKEVYLNMFLRGETSI